MLYVTVKWRTGIKYITFIKVADEDLVTPDSVTLENTPKMSFCLKS